MRVSILERLSFAGALLLALTLGSGSAEAGPFSALAGSWEGSGVLTVSDAREPIRCRAVYFVSNEGQSLRQILRCASASYVIDVNADVAARASQLAGTWSERTSGASGSLSGYVRGGVIQGTISGLGVSAPLLIVTRGRSQRASISLGGASGASVFVIFHRT